MLYDILLIDDDFITPYDLVALETNALGLFFDLIRSNLRVTYITGELDDLKKLKEKDLSCVKYIFCDLYLLGISKGDSIDVINSKLIPIINRLLKKINSKKITIFINSISYEEDYGDEGKNHLEEKIKSQKFQFITIKKISSKNILNSTIKNELLRNSLDIYTRSLIIDKVLEVEEILDKKLKLHKKKHLQSPFGEKIRKFINNFNLEKKAEPQLELLLQIRNTIAHTNNVLSEITDEDLRKNFWNIVKRKRSNLEIYFKKFAGLIKYVKSIDSLIKIINKANKKSTP